MKWTEEEIQFLKENYNELGRNECSYILGRSIGSIRSKASRLQLKSSVTKSKKAGIKYRRWLLNTEFELLEEYTRSQDKLLHRHISCGHLWYARPNNLYKGQNCPKCSLKPYSKMAIEWLNSFNNKDIQHAENGGEAVILDYKVDGFDPNTNTVYEFHGDCFHGNLDIYNEDEECHPFNTDVTAIELFTKTTNKMLKLSEVANVIYIWENDYKQGKPYEQITKGSHKIYSRQSQI